MATKFSTKPVISLLLVEDDEVILEILTSILSAKFPDIIIYVAANGRLAMELFKSHVPNIVITDINMSEMCGDQMSKEIRAIKPETKFIAITGQHPDDILFKFDHYIVKPVFFNDLITIIEKCIGGIAQN
jgi:YesN/AraC family two-component response regulator